MPELAGFLHGHRWQGDAARRLRHEQRETVAAAKCIGDPATSAVRHERARSGTPGNSSVRPVNVDEQRFAKRVGVG